jgi:hypothetical protein
MKLRKIREIRDVADMGAEKIAYRDLLGKHEGNRPLSTEMAMCCHIPRL